jgi:hypothetical protein
MVKRLDQLPLVDHKVDPRLEDRYRRRLHSPQSLAPNLRSRRIQVAAVGLSAGELQFKVYTITSLSTHL